MKTKINLEQTSPDSDQYRVVSLVNRVEPRVGKVIDAKEIEALLMEDEKLTVTIKKAR